MHPCYSRRTHPTLEKPGFQNLAACENKGKNVNREWWKENNRMMQKRQKVWLKYNFYQKILERKKVMRLVKPVNYSEIAINTQSN